MPLSWMNQILGRTHLSSNSLVVLRKQTLPRHVHELELDEDVAPKLVSAFDQVEAADGLIQPHTDEGGDAYYIGDFYEPAKCADEWRIRDERPRPYLDFVKRIATSRPHLEYLAHWMEVTCAPPKWKFVKKHQQSRDERAARCKVTVLDYDDTTLVNTTHFTDAELLRTAREPARRVGEPPPIRLIIAEDLSRDLVEVLGSTFDIDPLFFLSHIGDYLFHNTRDRWVELPDLDVVMRRRPFFNLSFLRARYFKDEPAFQHAEKESGWFNVLRRLDSDRSRKRLQDSLLDKKGASVTLSRSKASLWMKPRGPEDAIIGLLLVDPTVQEGSPLWGGYRPFDATPSMHDQVYEQPPVNQSHFNDVVYWSTKLTHADLTEIRRDPRCMALPMLRLVLAEWRTVLKYIDTMLGKIEWEFENPHWGETPSDIDNALRKLGPWRRNFPYYRIMIAEAIDRLFGTEVRTQQTRTPTSSSQQGCEQQNTLSSLHHDFHLLSTSLSTSSARVEGSNTTATNRISIEDARRAISQNQVTTGLGIAATIFLPLNFASSFLSMTQDFSAIKPFTLQLFFIIGLPLALLTVWFIDLVAPTSKTRNFLTRRKRVLQDWWAPHTVQVGGSVRPRGGEAVPIGRTMPWRMGTGEAGPLRR
ncbi:hypothetical protein LTR62_000776 [Meristemomyces frigidus]|uniref:Uncharacterized protein n=1 Tax=Meristemomyces frigidus TaxID=1508187 RepID=A0AAN7TKV9_9PEZI|nr:hypothetical protein LTR62_000776 [Meristemomyces frigidus]